jgi:hypothetical protein
MGVETLRLLIDLLVMRKNNFKISQKEKTIEVILR